MPGGPAESTFRGCLRQTGLQSTGSLGRELFLPTWPREPAPLLPALWDVSNPKIRRAVFSRAVDPLQFFVKQSKTASTSIILSGFIARLRPRAWSDEKLLPKLPSSGPPTLTCTVPEGSFMTVSHFLMPNMKQVGYHLNEEHPAAFAATHEGYEALRWRVPVDDTEHRCTSRFTSRRSSTAK